jgi:hypothetical protein
MKNKKEIFALTLILVLSFSIKESWSYNYIGAYSGPDLSWTDVHTGDFLSSFDSSDQWYQSEDRFYTSENNSFVDLEDMAYYSGHGNQYYITNIYGANTDLTTAGNTNNGGWGDNYLRYIVFDSCKVVPGPNDINDWAGGWWSVWSGVRQILGFRTEMNISSSIPSVFGQKVAAGNPIMSSWFAAIDEVGNHDNNRDYGAVVFCTGSESDTYPASLSAGPCPDTNTMNITWQD